MTTPTSVVDAPIAHLGLLTSQLETVIAFLSRMPGVGEWTMRENSVPPEEMIVGPAFSYRVAKARWLDIEIEILQPVGSPDSYIAKYIESHGEGFHHVGYRLASAVEHAALLGELIRQGGEIVHATNQGPYQVHYVASGSGGAVVELLSYRDEVVL